MLDMFRNIFFRKKFTMSIDMPGIILGPASFGRFSSHKVGKKRISMNAIRERSHTSGVN